MADVRGEDPTVAGGPFGTDDASFDAPSEPAISGKIAGRWDIVALIGTGGMGNVYRAFDRELGETVALKVLRRGGTSAPDALERFRHEVKLARRVTHTNVARTHDIGKHEDSLFLTMELVDGEPLTRRMARGNVSWRDAVAIAQGICSGVGAAHAAGVVHRDLKPDNVMLARDGRVVVTDFGIAATHELARGGDLVEVTGTPAWMAPEQLAGTADARSDVYAIGEILFAMLTGAHPWFADGKVQVMARVGAPAPRLPRGQIPDVVAVVVERCLHADPGHRFTDAGDLLDSLSLAESSGATGTGTPRTTTAGVKSGEVLVGVDAIKNLGSAEDDFVAVGLVEDLIDVLGRVRGLRVRALADRSGREDLDVVVGGSLRRAGEMVRISVRATGARDGFQIWSRRFDRRLDEILKLTDEVARDVASALSQTAARGTAGRDVATDQFVVELYLRARQMTERGWMDDPRPMTLYQAALERDPDSPIVLAAYATLLARRLGLNTTDVVAAVQEAEVLARRAIARGPDLPEPWIALSVAFYNQGRTVAAMNAAKIALDRGPGHAEAADFTGRMLLELDGALDDAIALLEQARWANPRLPSTHVDLVRGYALRGDWDRADELQRNPGTESAPAQIISWARMALWRGRQVPDVRADTPGLARFKWASESIAEVIRDGVLTDDNAGRWRQRTQMISASSRMRRYFAQLGAEIALRVGHEAFAWEMVDDALASGLVDAAWMDRMPLLAPFRGTARFAAARAIVLARGAPQLAVWRAPLPIADPDAWPE
jgi:serine/threonine-protein kinase